MKLDFEQFSQNLRLTKTEFKTLIFVFSIFIIGVIARQYKLSSNDSELESFDYSYHDSLFKALETSKKLSENHFKKKEKRVDSEAELYDFSNNKIDSKQNKFIALKNKSININTASKSEIVLLPGIGSKTSEKIIVYRSTKGSFKKIDDLLNVKNIGPKKLEKISQYIYIEN